MQALVHDEIFGGGGGGDLHVHMQSTGVINIQWQVDQTWSVRSDRASISVTKGSIN